MACLKGNMETEEIQSKNAVDETSGKLQGDVDNLKILFYGIIIVLFIGFAGVFIATASMLVDSFKNKQATYQDLANKVNEQNNKNDDILAEITSLKDEYKEFDCEYEDNGMTCQYLTN